MNISSRKLNLVQEFLRVSDEQLISKIEDLLLAEKKKKISQKLSPLTLEEFNSIIDQSENDIKTGNVAESKAVYKKISKWK